MSNFIEVELMKKVQLKSKGNHFQLYLRIKITDHKKERDLNPVYIHCEVKNSKLKYTACTYFRMASVALIANML